MESSSEKEIDEKVWLEIKDFWEFDNSEERITPEVDTFSFFDFECLWGRPGVTWWIFSDLGPLNVVLWARCDPYEESGKVETPRGDIRRTW